ncbi:MAG TPA: NUDIX hydrolase [Acidimicrobiales bacterium]|nr:NUDIX hydrolase [Acidimicrobiales bacterium]
MGDDVRYRGWRISVVEATFAAPDGTAFSRDIVRHPGAVAVVAVTDAGDVLLVRQYRGAVDRVLLEIPAGTRDVDGEPPEDTARRELLEEVGVHAGRLQVLGTMLNSPGFCDEETHLFLATGLEAGDHDREGVEEQHMEVVTVPLDDVDRLVASGELVDGQTIIGLLLARRALSAGPGSDHT